ncbi:hypothetical protein RJ639_023981 [Escallonia herrerae]|uniref:Reverse transcriptase RNase H-like domain-containing protein n=1 Tax=Escallonia herrerae TaxID=1293975 RepID=A0AA89ADQ9_9ASTE|nr:hypothetical protein RJ639_023981 [Escallonia herrerae]
MTSTAPLPPPSTTPTRPSAVPVQADQVELFSRVVVNTPAGGMEHSSRPRVPEPKSYGGACDAKELEKFLFDVEQYFRAIKVDSKETKVSMATMCLVGDAKFWWRKKYAEIEDGSYTLLLHGRVKTWACTELNRHRVNNLNEAIIAAKSLSDYNSEPQRPPNKGNPSRTNGGKKPGEEDAVEAFPQWCNAVTTQVGNPEGDASREKPKDTSPRKKGDAPRKGLMKLNEAEQPYTTHEKELLAIVHCLRMWRLLGSSIVVRMDNTVVSHFLSQSKLTSKYARWQELLAEFNFMLVYRAGSTNSVADALSRRTELDQLALAAMNAIIRADSRVAINVGKKIKKALTKDLVAVNSY